MSDLFSSYRLGHVELKNRIVMAPMTRSRRPDSIAGPDTAEYYAQRAGAGLIVTEGTYVSQEAQGYLFVPGMWTDEQAQGWRAVASAVHARGGAIFCQLWHVGRMSHLSLQPGRQAPVSSSDRAPGNGDKQAFAIRPDGTAGFVKATPPRALSTDEVRRVTEDFARAARLAGEAGLDGVEIHAANGYLFEQFLNPNVNDREDAYGGSVENRTRFLLETVDRMLEEIGPGRVAVRLSPFGHIGDMQPYPEAAEQYLYLASQLATRQLAYVHLKDQVVNGERLDEGFLREFKRIVGKPLILAGGMTKELATDLIARGLIDLAAFGRSFIANPDLVHRFQVDAEIAVPDPTTYYGGGSEGYTDYPFLSGGTESSQQFLVETSASAEPIGDSDKYANVASIEERLRRLEDERSILDTLHTYAHALDYGVEEEWANLWTDDAVLQWGKMKLSGDMILEAFKLHPHAPETYWKHFMVEPRVQVNGDEARVASYLARFTAEAEGPRVASFGRYLDVLQRCSDGNWRFVERIAQGESKSRGGSEELFGPLKLRFLGEES